MNFIDTPPIENTRLPKKVFADLLPIFLEEILDEFSHFQCAFSEKNKDDCVLVLHKISGITKTYGANSLAYCISVVNKNITSGKFEPDDVNFLNKELEAVFAFAKKEFGAVIS